MSIYLVGLDIGSTTVKVSVIDENDNIVHQEYRRHLSDINASINSIIGNCSPILKDANIKVAMTGSGAVDVAKFFNIEFVQEVSACTKAVEKYIPDTDVAIELGGEDAKITYFRGTLEQRMNGTCAGGTGAFIDQMATLLKTDAAGLNKLAAKHTTIYPIASRCGVYAKSDIQPLLNDGAKREDIAASVFQAVVNQTISSLAQGRPIKGNIAFLGGPLHFSDELRKLFISTLNLSDDQHVCPDDANYYVALGAALCASKLEPIPFKDFYKKIVSDISNDKGRRTNTLDPLFKDADEYDKFIKRHSSAIAKRADINTYKGKAFLGIDAGSTTTKLVLTTENGEILYTFYGSNRGNPLTSTIDALKDLYTKMTDDIEIAYSAITGYGEHLLKAAINIDFGEIETIAHFKAANFFRPGVSFILDIGGQDMKCMYVENGVISSILLNEACSSGCGSFIETFAKSLNVDVKDFAQASTKAKLPVDLGTRCTVFMNSKVKQAQREGASVEDISAGLTYSVIKNALFKVIRLRNPESLGENIVVQGGTFYNNGILRAFEKITGREVTRPDIAGLMGAFGAAIVAKEHYNGQKSTLMGIDQLNDFTFETTMERCGQCGNNCLLTINRFNGDNYFVTGNRCEKGAEKYVHQEKKEKTPNLFEYKYDRVFGYKSLSLKEAKRGLIGIPRVLNMYEDYPFWHTFFTSLGYTVAISGKSDRKIYELGMETIPSESTCYPGKIVHGHIEDLKKKHIKNIFYPCVVFNMQEDKNAGNNFNCPVVGSYPETIRANVDLTGITFHMPFLNLNERERVVKILAKEFEDEGVTFEEAKIAVEKAYSELEHYKDDVRVEGERALKYMEEHNGKGIVLCGRPYHMDPEINHGIPEMIQSYGLTVLSEDSILGKSEIVRPLRIVDQWTYHTRLYAAATYVSTRNDLEMIQLNSFGCGLDAVTTDQCKEILEGNNKIYTTIKIDEINNLGTVRIRIRSLIASMADREKNQVIPTDNYKPSSPRKFTKEMKATHTILAPQMSPIHFQFMEAATRKSGYKIEVLPSVDRGAIEEGLKCVHNDACYPSIIVTGQLIKAIKSGNYDLDNTSVMISQTGGGCRATNYIAFIRKALKDAGLEKIPVISANMVGLEENPGFKLDAKLISKMLMGLVLGDVLMKVTYRCRPYEKIKGSTEKMYKHWVDECNKVIDSGNILKFNNLVPKIIEDFETLELDESIIKPKVGIVGEILVKFHPTANNDVFGLLESEGAEVVVPDLLDFFLYSSLNGIIKYNNDIKGSKKDRFNNSAATKLIKAYKNPAVKAFKKSNRFYNSSTIEEIARKAENYISLNNQCGEGWLLTGEMVELIENDVNNILCIQPFACLPNHIVGKGMIKKLKDEFNDANIVAIDYDPGASEVNQVNRIKLMLTTARRNLEKKETEKEFVSIKTNFTNKK